MSQPIFSADNTHNIIDLDQHRGSQPSAHIFDYPLNRHLGKGLMRFIKLDLGFRVIEINYLLKHNVQLNLYNSNKNFLYFLYCTEGQLYHKFNEQYKVSEIKELCLSIVGSIKDDDSYFLLKKNKPIQLSLICIDKSIFFKEYFSKTFSQKQNSSKTEGLIKALNKLNNKVYSCVETLKFAEDLRSIKPLEVADEFLDILEIQSQYQKLLFSYFKQFYQELFVERSKSRLNTYELQQIRKASEYISENLDFQHTIKSLCSLFGVSPAKLQEGFKAMHKTTVSEFIRNNRLLKAKEFFLTTDLNVSEVVYRLGITSRSYFCKIFKLKFGTSPSSFRKKMYSN